MSYLGEACEVNATFRPVAEVPSIVRPSTEARLAAPGTATNGQYGLFEWRWLLARAVISGTCREGGIHAFRNDSDDPASMLLLFAPRPPRERYFSELAEIGDSGRQLSAQEWTELCARHDQYMV